MVVYNAPMSGDVLAAKVSHRGQTSLPAALRRRWGIENGGEVAFVDLGSAALILPGGTAAARQELRRVLLAGGYDAGVAGLGEPDLADQ
jgi:hypothetical protein